uniref:EGF-like domain-containing protein n=1 Tax=Periophthalmus magnuspinnatus TaxID=409849 RepID=A0A3B4AFK4_9GOBI
AGALGPGMYPRSAAVRCARAALALRSAHCLFVTEYFTRTPRKLNAFNSFASVELFHFNVPDDTMMAVWNLITFKEQGGTFGDNCPNRNVTVYFRSGAPPVINPLYTRFPRDTVVPGSFAVTLTWTLPNRTTGAFNVTSPLPGDWFLAAHLPKDEGKISVKGLSEECQYLFQPQLIVQRLIGISVLYPGYFIDQMIPAHNRSALYKYVKVQLVNCSTKNKSSDSCPVVLKIRARAPPVHNSSALDCREWNPCELASAAPAWEQWYYILVERYLSNADVYFRIGVQITVDAEGCQCHGVRLPQPRHASVPERERDSQMRIRYSAFHMLTKSKNPDYVVFLKWHLRHKIVTSHCTCASCCVAESVAGFFLSVNASSNITKLRIPYPQTGTWYLSLRSLCATEHGFEPCTNVTAEVYMRSYLTPCINDCGTYGQCKLLRTNNYLYAACECKAGWDGWGCTDNTEAYSYSFQLLSTLLLCLSNLMFVPPVAIAIRSHYLLEASVYIFTMFFSTFYHACDQPGIVVFCIMEYDVLQFCDFLGSLMSVWVTVIAMARLKSIIKQVLYLLGAMSLSMALQLDRHGLWNLLGPSLFALGIMAVAWTVRTIRRRRCYPPTWKRWVFFLFPGTMIATSAVALYAFVETEENYFYIHSIWHMLIAGSVGFLLPPRAKPDAKVTPLKRRRGCGYQLCVNEHEELGLVDPSLISINSICTS